ncbi:8557_t:CDS:2, partial [Cetraspora pellucida]
KSTDSLENMSYESHEFDNKPTELCEIRSESEEFENLIIDEDLDNELLDSNFLKEKFEISANKIDIEKNNNYELPSKIKDIIHLDINPVAKWDLKLLFNELQLL